MPNDDPQYVRLANRLSRGILADVEGSGWSISGLDVKPFPEGTNAARFVRHALRDGKLEPASRAEHEEVQSEAKKVADTTHQEAKVMGAALEGHARLSESRASDDDADSDDDDDDRVRQFDEESDDPEEQASRNTQRRGGTATATKTKAKGGKKSKVKESASSED